MDRARWQHLDRERPPARHPPAEPAPPARNRAPLPAESPPTRRAATSSLYRQADSHWRLGQLRECRRVLEAGLDPEDPDPGSRELLGLCLGRLGDTSGAVRELTRAAAANPTVPLPLQASLLSARILLGERPEPQAAVPGPAGEFGAAAAWLTGQEFLRREAPAEAAARFQDSARRFLLAATRETVATRVAAAYLGLTTGLLLAGHLDAAEQAFARLGACPNEAGLLQSLARQTQELTTCLRETPPGERPTALVPLRELLLGARLRVEFYDQTGPAVLGWDEL